MKRWVKGDVCCEGGGCGVREVWDEEGGCGVKGEVWDEWGGVG